MALDLEVAERHLMEVEGIAEHAGRLGEEGEAELREELPQGAPAPGENASPDVVGTRESCRRTRGSWRGCRRAAG